MARFVLVHGTFSGTWIWGPLTDQLKAAGHTVDAFDLPGLGDDNTPAGGSHSGGLRCATLRGACLQLRTGHCSCAQLGWGDRDPGFGALSGTGCSFGVCIGIHAKG